MKEQCVTEYVQNFFGEHDDIARCIENSFAHPYDSNRYTMADTLLPDLDDYDFVNDPAAKLKYEQHYERAVYLHLAQPVRTLDELVSRLQKVIPARDPLECINIAVKEASKR